MTESSDEELIASSEVEPEQFASIFERHHGAVYAYLQRRIGRDDARELAAETFVIAFRKRAEFDGARGSTRGWLLGIATNLVRRHWRSERRRLRAYARTGIDPVASGIEAAEDRADAARAGPALARALAALPRVERDALLLDAWEGLSGAEIAAALDIPIGTVHSRLARARRRMREAIRASGQ